MGYDLHITRKEHWADHEQSNISFDEWLAYVKTDSELELINGFEIKIGSEAEFKNAPGFCEWNAPTEKDPNARPWFDYWKGSIDTKNPDEPTIHKMIHIATALNAKVQGDEGEFYDEEYLIELEKSQKQRSSSYQEYKKPWWKIW